MKKLSFGSREAFPTLVVFLCLSAYVQGDATFVYPNTSSSLTVNYVDTVNVIYTTSWSSVNLWVYCLDATHSDYHDYYLAYGSPLYQSDTVTIPHIGNPNDLQGILQFPTPCWFKIADSSLGTGVNDDADTVPGIVGGNFTMKSVDGVPTQTWSSGSTPTGINGGATATGTGVTNSQSPSAAGSSSNLSTAAKAGVGVGVGVPCAAVAGLAVYVFMLRRKRHAQDEELKRLSAIQNSRDYRDVNDSKFARKELPAVTVQQTVEADDGQPKHGGEPLRLET